MLLIFGFSFWILMNMNIGAFLEYKYKSDTEMGGSTLEQT
jgi:hypothetical protein